MQGGRLNGDCAARSGGCAFRHGEVDEQLLELTGVHTHGPVEVVESRADTHVVAQEALQQSVHFRHALAGHEDRHLPGRFAGKRLKLAHEHASVFRGDSDLRKVARLGVPLAGERRHAEYRRQHVVEVVRHTRHQSSHAGAALTLAQFRFERTMLRDVARVDNQGRLAAGGRRDRRDTLEQAHAARVVAETEEEGTRDCRPELRIVKDAAHALRVVARAKHQDTAPN